MTTCLKCASGVHVPVDGVDPVGLVVVPRHDDGADQRLLHCHPGVATRVP